MNITTNIIQIYEDQYDTDIIVSGVKEGTFPAITRNRVAEGSDTREIEVEIMNLEQSPGGDMEISTRAYRRKTNEVAVKVTIKEGESELTSSTTNY